ncbi:MAG: YitT family protein [Eubacteriales bacterium]
MKNGRKYFYDALAVVCGSVLFAMGFNMFVMPGGIIMGGATGIATVVNMFLGAPVGVVIMIVNIPLLLVNTRIFGRHFFIKTLVGVVSTSAAVDLLRFFPVTIYDPFLCALFGGIITGAALGILFSRGFTTGGTDLAACLLGLKFKRVSTGTLIMICDGVIIAAAALLTRNFAGIFYSALITYVGARAIDIVTGGMNVSQLAFIISEHRDVIKSRIMDELDRGVTLLDGHGGYTGTRRDVIMCVVSKRELHELKALVLDEDKNAFIIFTEASQVVGEGFADTAFVPKSSKNDKKTNDEPASDGASVTDSGGENTKG